MWQRILVATDGTDSAHAAATQAIALAKLSKAQLFAVFVTDPVDFDQDMADQMALIGTTELKRLKQEALAQEISLQGELRSGEPVAEILAMAKTMQADLIVVAPHHQDFFYRLLIQQSVSDRVIHQATQSILMINALPQPSEAASVSGLAVLNPLEQT